MTRPPNSPTLPALVLDGARSAGSVAVAKGLWLWTVACFSLASALLPREEYCHDLGSDE